MEGNTVDVAYQRFMNKGADFKQKKGKGSVITEYYFISF